MTSTPTDPYAGLGEAIRELRLERGATRNQVKDAAKISLEYLGKIERGDRKPQADVMARIAATLGTTPTELLARARGLREGVHGSPVVAGAVGLAIGGLATGPMFGAAMLSAAKDLRRRSGRRQLLEELESRLDTLSDDELALLVAAIPQRAEDGIPGEDELR